MDDLKKEKEQGLDFEYLMDVPQKLGVGLLRSGLHKN